MLRDGSFQGERPERVLAQERARSEVGAWRLDLVVPRDTICASNPREFITAPVNANVNLTFIHYTLTTFV